MFDIPKYNTRMGTVRAYHLAAIVFISSFMSGYDSGVAGGILTFKPFESDFKYTTAGKNRVNSLTVGLGNLGSFLACFIIYPLTNRIGRRYCIMLSAFVFIIGAALQTGNTHSLASWYVARIISGLGQGGLSVVVPMYSAEMTPREIRGRCGSFYQWMYTWGIFTSYWVDYGVAAAYGPTASKMWQIPVALQLVSSGILFLGAFTLPESVRWLLAKDRPDEAWTSLAWIRADTSDVTTAEFNEIKQGIAAEAAATAGFSIRELWEPANRLRFFLGAMLFTLQNGTGSSALAVFGPQFFKLLVGSKGNRDLLLTGLFGAVKVIACSFFIFVLAERFGRRSLLSFGSAAMAACMLTIAVVDKYKPAPKDEVVTASGKAMVALIYLDIMIYNCSWGPVPWAYVPEIFPTRIRALGLAVSVAAHWASSFVFSFSSPYMIANIGWATFLVFFALDVCAGGMVWLLVRETRGKSLEGASGVEWETVERAVGDKYGGGYNGAAADTADERGLSGRGDVKSDAAGVVVVTEADGHEVEVVAARVTPLTFGLKHRS